jgi:lysyl-tRNA synthetase class 2
VTPGLDPFILRMKLESRLRAALEKKGYQEVMTPVLQPAPGPDPGIEPFIARYDPLMEPDPPGREMYLAPSPEFAMKRLLCRGLDAIYQIGPVFRQGESGPLHSPEFFMAEWYRAGWTYRELMEEVEAVVVETVGDRVTVNGAEINLAPPLARISVAEAMKRSGIDAAAWIGLGPAEWIARFHEAFVDRLEPWLKQQGAVFLVDFPASLALLSRLQENTNSGGAGALTRASHALLSRLQENTNSGGAGALTRASHALLSRLQENTNSGGAGALTRASNAIAERFELIIAGVEIANGCTELIDPAEHRRRFAADQELRRMRGQKVYPLPEEFLRDLETLGLPPCAGVALGVDRLAMIAAGAKRIEEVQAFPFAR